MSAGLAFKAGDLRLGGSDIASVVIQKAKQLNEQKRKRMLRQEGSTKQSWIKQKLY